MSKNPYLSRTETLHLRQPSFAGTSRSALASAATTVGGRTVRFLSFIARVYWIA